MNSIRHIGIVVNDLNKTKKFWIDVLGFTEVITIEEGGNNIDSMIGIKGIRLITSKLTDKNGSMVELLKFNSHKDKEKWNGKPYSTGLTHIAITVENIEETLSKIKKFGIDYQNKIVFSKDNSVKVTYANGPEGLLIELVEML